MHQVIVGLTVVLFADIILNGEEKIVDLSTQFSFLLIFKYLLIKRYKGPNRLTNLKVSIVVLTKQL